MINLGLNYKKKMFEIQNYYKRNRNYQENQKMNYKLIEKKDISFYFKQ